MPTVIFYAFVCVLAFALAAASDYLDTRFVQIVGAGDAHAAARTSVTMWAVGLASLYTCVEISWWLALPEGAGLYLGTWYAMRHSATSRAASVRRT